MKKHTLTFDTVVLMLNESTGKHREIAKATGVPYSTVRRIAAQITPNPGVLAVEAIGQYFLTQGSHGRV